MKTARTAVVYFSQTGNTERVAQAIGRGLSRAGTAVETFDLLATDPRTMLAYELVGIGAPVFYYREPVVVERFIKAMPGMPGRHAFIFLTSGGNPANTFHHMARALRRRGLVVIDSYACHGYDTYPPFIGQDRFAGHPDRDEIAAAQEFGTRLPVRLERVRDGDLTQLPRFARQWDRMGRLSIIFRSGLMSKLLLPRKVVNREKCIRCGICVDRCPVKIIRLDPFPVFARGCIHCYLCERVCPVDAIECDWRFIKRKMQSYEKKQAEGRK